MSTRIEWTNETWNPTRGCTKVSAGCVNCYAMRQAHRFSGPGQPYEGLTHVVPGRGPQWTGEVRPVPEALDLPLRWRKPRQVFVDSMSDLFHPDVPFCFVDRVFGVMATCPHHTFQVLTKRPERMAEYLSDPMRQRMVRREVDRVIDTCGRPTHESAGADPWPLPNVWLGTSCENQAAADERIPHLLRCSAAMRFLSCEPLLGPVDLSKCVLPRYLEGHCATRGVHWVIAGGESGPGARPCDVAWLRSLRDQCAAAEVPYFLKQLGARPFTRQPEVFGRGRSEDRTSGGWWHELRDPKGGDPAEWPEDLRMREFPRPAEAQRIPPSNPTD